MALLIKAGVFAALAASDGFAFLETLSCKKKTTGSGEPTAPATADPAGPAAPSGAGAAAATGACYCPHLGKRGDRHKYEKDNQIKTQQNCKDCCDDMKADKGSSGTEPGKWDGKSCKCRSNQAFDVCQPIAGFNKAVVFQANNNNPDLNKGKELAEIQ